MADLSLLQALAAAFLAGEPSVEQIVVRASTTLGRSWRWLQPLAQRYVKMFSGGTRPRKREVIRFLRNDEGFTRAIFKYRHEIGIESWLTEPQQMHPVAAAEAWDIPEIESVGALAEWFGVSSGELRWFADLKGLTYKGNATAAPPLPLSNPDEEIGWCPVDRSAETAVEGVAATNTCPDTGSHSTSSSRPWLRSRTVNSDFRCAARRSTHRSADGPTGFLSHFWRGEDSEPLSHDRLPGSCR